MYMVSLWYQSYTYMCMVDAHGWFVVRICIV